MENTIKINYLHQTMDMDTGDMGKETHKELTAKITKNFIIIDWFGGKVKISKKVLLTNRHWDGYWVNSSSRISINEKDVELLK